MARLALILAVAALASGCGRSEKTTYTEQELARLENQIKALEARIDTLEKRGREAEQSKLPIITQPPSRPVPAPRRPEPKSDSYVKLHDGTYIHGKILGASAAGIQIQSAGVTTTVAPNDIAAFKVPGEPEMTRDQMLRTKEERARRPARYSLSKLTSTIGNALGKRHRAKGSPGFSVVREADDVYVTWMGNDNFTNSMIKGGMKLDVGRIASAVHSAGTDYKALVLTCTFKFRDKYGKTEEGNALVVDLRKAELDKVNWKDTDLVDFLKLSESTWWHPAFR